MPYFQGRNRDMDIDNRHVDMSWGKGVGWIGSLRLKNVQYLV